VVLGVLLMLGSVSGVAGRWAARSYANHSVHRQDLLGGAAKEPAAEKKHASLTGAKTILLVGVDNRPDQPVADLIRADSIIIVHVPSTYDSAYMVSLPRDLRVEIPAFNNGKFRYNGGHDRINAAYAFGGTNLTGDAQRQKAVELLALTIRENFGISFDGAAIVDFTGFQQVVNVLGGVDMYVDQRTVSVHIGFTRDGRTKVPFRQSTGKDGSIRLDPVAGVAPQVYEVGQQHLSPWQALDYVRQRETLPNSDYDRQRHQQQFLKAVVRQILSADTLSNPVKLAEVLKIVGRSMTVDSGNYDMDDWIYAMRSIRTDDIFTLKTNNGTFHPSSADAGMESLDDTTLALLESVKDEKVPEFVLNHADLRSTG
jgi:LCP family protein required for cell wall assembly